MRPVADSYPLSMIVMAITLGILGALVYANLWAGLAVGFVSLLFGLWYWREGGRGRRLLAEFSRDADGQPGGEVSGES